MPIGDIRAHVKGWRDDLSSQVRNIGDMAMHRLEYGSPPLLDASEDAMVNPLAGIDVKQARIRRRRKLLGLPYEEWTGKAGSR